MNERDEWELPGGKLELGETPQACLVREVEEELGLRVEVGPILDSWLYHIVGHGEVFIVTYGCSCPAFAAPTKSPEHKDVWLFSPGEVAGLRMPDGYKQSIAAWVRYLAEPAAE